MRYGANAIMTEYEKNGEVKSLSFRIEFNGKDLPFRLPCRYTSIHDVLLRRRKRVRLEDEARIMEQAKRVGWRQILRWVEAQLALVETNMVEIQEVFMPYIIDQTGQTIYEKLKANNFKAIENK